MKTPASLQRHLSTSAFNRLCVFVISQAVSAQCCDAGGFQPDDLAVPKHDDLISGNI